MRRCALVAVLCVLLLPAPAQATFPGANGKIAFAKDGDIYTMDPDGTNQTNLTNDGAIDSDPTWSRDGAKIVFAKDISGSRHLWIMNADGTNATQITFSGSSDQEPYWLPDGRIIFTSDDGQVVMSTVNADGTNRTVFSAGKSPAWSPDGEPVVYSVGDPDNPAERGLRVVNPDGTGSRILTTSFDFNADWSPDHQFIVFDRQQPGWQLFMMRHETQQAVAVPVPGGSGVDREPVWSPDGTKLAFSTFNGSDWDIATMNIDGTGRTTLTGPGSDETPSWQPVGSPTPVTGYPRPKGATPVDVALVPTYASCGGDADRVHGPPLAYASCSAPDQLSQYATVGTADSNARPTKSSGHFRLDTIVGDPTTAADEADVRIQAHVTDIRCRMADTRCSGPALSDYTASLRGVFDVQITDRLNGYTQAREATLTPVEMTLTIPCTPTPDTTVGSTCEVSTTMDSLVPGIVRERKRAVWQLGLLSVEDSADLEEERNFFLRPGVFVPNASPHGTKRPWRRNGVSSAFPQVGGQFA